MRTTAAKWFLGAATYAGMLGGGLFVGLACGDTDGSSAGPPIRTSGGPHVESSPSPDVSSRMALETSASAGPEIVLYFMAADPRFEDPRFENLLTVGPSKVRFGSLDPCSWLALETPQVTLQFGVEQEAARYSLTDAIAASPAPEEDWYWAEVQANVERPFGAAYLKRTDEGWSEVAVAEIAEADRVWKEAGSPTQCPAVP